jgi:hypothetical protein
MVVLVPARSGLYLQIEIFFLALGIGNSDQSGSRTRLNRSKFETEALRDASIMTVLRTVNVCYRQPHFERSRNSANQNPNAPLGRFPGDPLRGPPM